MQTDFHDAHKRHWDDAETLFGANRLATADHLFGISAECGLKALMKVFGMPIDADGGPNNRYDREHIDRLERRYQTYLAGRIGPQYGLPLPWPFTGWRSSDRYAHRRDFDMARVEGHRQGAEDISTLVRKAELAGLPL